MDPVLEQGLVCAMTYKTGGGIFGTQAEAARMSSGTVEALDVNSLFAQFYQRVDAPWWPSDAVLGGAGGMVGFTVHLPIGKIELVCGRLDNIAGVKAMIEDKEGMPSYQQRLIFAGRRLNDGQTLADCNIGNGAVLELYPRQVGGSGGSSAFRFYFTDPQYFDRGFNFDFSKIKVDDAVYYRGGKQYQRPLGAKRYAIQVLGQYADDKWLGENAPRTHSSPNEWPVAYHGTKERFSGSIVRKGFDLSKGQCFKYGRGIYCTPDPNVARDRYGRDYTFKDRRYRLVFQTRVDPSVLRVVKEDGEDGIPGEYWLVPDGKHIRPYGICVYPMKSAAN